MADILWDKKVGTYDVIDSNYLTPEPHAHNIGIDLEIEVYLIHYDWGSTANANLEEFKEPYFVGTLSGKVTSADFTLDSTSDMRTSGSFSIILDEDSPFIVQANDFIFWQHVWFRVIKKYNYINDIDMYPMFNWGDRIGLWNNNGLFRSDPSQSIIGWFVPNDGSYSYNADTRELSISCTDMLSFYTDTRGGHLSDFVESIAGLNYKFYGTADNNDEKFNRDKEWSAVYASGILIEGEKNLQLQDGQYNNFFTSLTNGVSDPETLKESSKSIDRIWSDAYSKYITDRNGEDDIPSNYDASKYEPEFRDTASLISDIVRDNGQLIPIANVYVDLQNGYEMLPFDLDFNGDTCLYDILKKITDLYPRQFIFFDVMRRLNLVQQALSWGDIGDNAVKYRASEFSDLVLEERWNVNLENIKNFTVVWGRDQSCHGYYYMTSYQAICPVCGRLHEFPGMSATKEDRYCLSCGSDLIRLHVTNNTYCVQQIGTHKQVIYDDNVTTEEEAFNTAKWLTTASCRAGKMLSVTLVDRFLSMYQADDKGVGRRIEYKSKLTGETDVYTVLKWSNPFNSGTVTMELEPYYPCIDERISFGGYMVLPIPTFTYSVDENGLLTMIITNGAMTKYSLFKIYCNQTNKPVDNNTDFWFWSIPMNFIGETCEVYSEETENEFEKKVFRYQFTQNGRYWLTCQAWSPNIHPSGCKDMRVIEVNAKALESKYISCDGVDFVTEDNENYVS